MAPEAPRAQRDMLSISELDDTMASTKAFSESFSAFNTTMLRQSLTDFIKLS
ncbi:hypothetical protein D3C84_1056820 [compost metagenome]